MAESKNIFLKGNMNKDLDNRLLGEGEYRDALNISVGKSEDKNVGSLQNILGNSLTVNFNTLAGTTGLECIGVHADESNNNLYGSNANNNRKSTRKANNNNFYDAQQSGGSSLII